MERKYLKDLLEWKDDEFRKPLFIWGARQVGKSYLLEEIFAKNYFKDNYIVVDCANDKKFIDFCFAHPNDDELISYLSLENNKDIINIKTLLIFDEAQECLPIISLMKYFCQNHRDIPVIVTGSMVRIKLLREIRKASGNFSFLFPIGKINELTIYPLNFEEYLMNCNKYLYEKLLTDYTNGKSQNDSTHLLAMNLFNEYLLIGGMPEVEDVYFKTKSFIKALSTLKEIYDNYLNDMSLYQASPEAVIRSKDVFRNIYNQLNKENKNFRPSQINKKFGNRELRTSLDWLQMAFLVEKSFQLKERVTIPLIESEDSLYRLYLSDIGIFTYQSGINATTFIDSKASNSLAGIFFENYVANELTNAGFKLFYWKGKNDAEFEFVIENNGYIIPIDVKKNRGTLNSLEKFKEHNRFICAIKVSNNNYGYAEDKKILTIPYYYFPFLLKELKERPIEEIIKKVVKNKEST